MKLHVKGFLLQRLAQVEHAWDTRLVTSAMEYYGLVGARWRNTLLVALDELASAGLIESAEARLALGVLQFRYRLTGFGKQRMADTGLAEPLR